MNIMMSSQAVLIVSVLLCSSLFSVFCDDAPKKVGEPIFTLNAAGGGNNAKNFVAGYQAGVGTKVWESKNKDKSLELGVGYGRNYARVDGHTFKSKPVYGLGGTFRWGRK